MKVDLHCHSCFSDGLLTPVELLYRAANLNLDYFALTDHDTLLGVHDLHSANSALKVNIINGVEISSSWKKYDIHVLGYNFNLEDKDLDALFVAQKTNRLRRAHEISEKLEKYGIHDAFLKAEKYAYNGNIGRPHFAKVLLDEGLIKDISQAFTIYLGTNKKAYVPSCWIELADTVRMIKNAGGDAVLAHPLKYKLTNTKLRELIANFKQAGGDGIEVVSSDLPPIYVNKLAELCLDYDLMASSGSDFHGDNISRVGIGLQKSLPEMCKPIWSKWS